MWCCVFRQTDMPTKKNTLLAGVTGLCEAKIFEGWISLIKWGSVIFFFFGSYWVQEQALISMHTTGLYLHERRRLTFELYCIVSTQTGKTKTKQEQKGNMK